MPHMIFLVLLAVFCSGTVQAGELRKIELRDGTILTGEVLSLSGGIYTVSSDTLGTLKIQESKVLTISSSTRSGQTATSNSDLRGLQERMLGDKEVMSRIQSLQNDPDFQKVLEDPALMNAVNRGDVATLMANPQFQKLLNNATVREIESKVK